ncbi:MAG: PDZ domain-containing protein [Planctomycetes bacterium]|nr:PDZ domain-containing protein [Planctomycetota bacterium]
MYRSTDGGKTFGKVSTGLPSVDLGRIDIEFCRSNPNVALAVIESSKIGQEPENAPYLGIQGEDAEVGARLTQIVEGGPAEQAGLKQGDIVIAFEEHTVQSYEDLIGRMREHLAGDTVKIEVSRERKSVECEVTLARRPGSEEDKPAPEGGEAPQPAAPAEELKRPGEEKGREESSSPFQDFLGGQVANVQRQQGPEGHECGGIYRSEDGGATWRRINSVNPRPMYFSQIRVDPSDEKRIYVLGISLHRSEDGAETFDGEGAGDSVHVDHHALWIDPRDGRHMILGNDGGIYVSWDRGAAWEHLNRMAIGQFYHVAVDSRRHYRVYGGLQDNGTWGGPSRTANRGGPINEDWINIGGGDGFICRVDPKDPDQVYFESQEGGLGRINLRTGERGFMRPKAPRGVRYRFNWQTPFILSHHNPAIYYAAGNYVFRSLSQGDDLKAISPEITNTDKGSASALAESPLDPAVLYVGSDDGALWVTRDGGAAWTNLFAPPAEQPASAQPPVAEQPAPEKPADPLSGAWQAESFGGGGPRSEFSLELQLGAEGAVSGGFSSQMADGELARGKFDARKGELTAALESEMFSAELRARLEGDLLKGTIEFEGGFAREFEARRAAQARQEDPYDWKRIAELLAQPMWVSAIEPSRHEPGRVYLAIDGHRSNVDDPLLFVSEDFGERWRPLAVGLQDGAGATRVIREDIVNPDVLYAGTEFGAFVSIDRGATWTSLNTNLPTVAVHEIAQHESAGEIVAATHGRSLWVLDVTALRQLSPRALADEFRLYRPGAVTYWRSEPQRGGTLNRFEGEDPRAEACIGYSLGARTEHVRLEVKDYTGRTLREFETAREPGVHVARWDLREAGGEGRRRRGPRVPPGTYLVLLTVGSTTQSQPLVVEGDPARPGEDDWGEEEDP